MVSSEVDPFPLTANARMYVARPAMERALDGLLKLLRGGELCVRLAGPAGLGKTLLLRRVAGKLERSWRCVYLPYPKLGPEELWAWTAAELGVRGTPEEAVARVAAKAHDRGGALLLMIDDAQLQPAETRRRIAKACARQVGLRFLLCETLDLAADAGDGAPGEVWLTEPPSASEARVYLRERLRLSGASAEACALFDDPTIDELHRQAGGSVATFHTLATALLRGKWSASDDWTPIGSEPAPTPRPETPEEPQAVAEPTPDLVAAPEPDVAVSEPIGPPRRSQTDREAIDEIAANLPFTFRRPSPEASRASASPGHAAPEIPRLPGVVDETSGATPASAAPAGRALPSARAATRSLRLGSVATPVWLEALSGERARWIAFGLLGGLLLGVGGSLLATRWLSPGGSTSPVVVTPSPEAPGTPDVAAAPPLKGAAPAAATGVAAFGSPVVPGRGVLEPPRTEEPSSAASPTLPPPILGQLNVNAIPWASIEIDGELVGETPLGELLLPQGSRRVVARFPDGQVTTRIVELAGDEIFLVLRPEGG